MKRASWVAALAVVIGAFVPRVARADDRTPVVFVDDNGVPIASTTSTTTTVGPASTTTVTTTQTVQVARSMPSYPQPQPQPQPTQPSALSMRAPKLTWLGISLGAVATPFSTPKYLQANDKLTSNHFRACLMPGDKRYCSSLRGFDVRVQLFNSSGAWDYPRWIGYFRTGYRAGHADFEPQGGGQYHAGEATALSYASVPLFFGGSVYAFKHFPIRPFAGLGVGLDVTRISYARHGERGVTQTSVRPGIEIHAGVEARISNFVAITFEAQQLWSARRRVQDLPTVSGSALTLMAGVAISLPSPGSWSSWRQQQSARQATSPWRRPVW
jgi:hypothetical protein